MQIITLPVEALCVTCLDQDIEELFDATDFEGANKFLKKIRDEFPDCDAFMTADIEA